MSGVSERPIDSDLEGVGVRRSSPFKSAAIILAKLSVTGVCLWYVSRQIDLADFRRLFVTFDLWWAVVAVLAIMIEAPLVALRWRLVLDALTPNGTLTPLAPMVAITAITVFIGQIMPNLAADAVRVWFASRLGLGWRYALPSVVIDRALGVYLLAVVGFVTLLFPSAFTALAGYRMIALQLFGFIVIAGVAGILLVPFISPVLERFSPTKVVGRFASLTHFVLIRSRARFGILVIALLIHLLTIFAVWSLGRAQGQSLSIADSALLFTLMASVSLVPVSIGGWGLRELAVSTLLGSYGVPVEQALFFSVSYGLVLIVAGAPGAVVWAFFSPERYAPQVRSAHE